ncbi:aspartate racemase [Neobacillus bataviensis]|uniref:Aspartate racemase n=1 Tax=Neobacillus bataviensis TaxID=220685 RepID=A0A561CRC2_9BACI|nr:aspartate/glutamate racemase family protein [Neobacillus bataviensis]TWD93368.1 aspartate racemase [Neobacillus bataviensis]
MIFFIKPFISNNIEMVVPNQSEQDYIHRKIVEELENGIVNKETKEGFLSIINQMIVRNGIQGIVLGCTELPMIIKNEDLNIHTLNTAEIHIKKIVDIIFTDNTN